MGINNMVQFVKQLSGRLNPNMYTSIANQTDAASIAFLRRMQRELKREYVLDIPISELKVIAFDLETTGFHPHKGDRILSIGAVKVVGSQVQEADTFYSLVKTQGQISEEIVNLTGITEEQLGDAPPIEKVLKDFFQFINNDTLVAHHSNHEKTFMDHVTWSILRTNFQHRLIDTAFLTKIAQPNEQLVTLGECCAHYGIKIEQRHHALHDAVATAKLWAENVKLIQKLGFSDLNDVYGHLAKMK